jgi:hypothetical protein
MHFILHSLEHVLCAHTSFAVPTLLLDRVQPAGGAAFEFSLLVRLVLLVGATACVLLFIGLLLYDLVLNDSMVNAALGSHSCFSHFWNFY